MTFLFGFGLGFLAGWLLIKRPQWVTDGIAWLRLKTGW